MIYLCLRYVVEAAAIAQLYVSSYVIGVRIPNLLIFNAALQSRVLVIGSREKEREEKEEEKNLEIAFRIMKGLTKV